MSRELHDGRHDGLEPLEALDLRKVTCFSDLLRQMSRTAFGGRELGEAYEVLSAMTDDGDCTVVLTLSGAMTIAKMGKVICEMIDGGLAHVIVSTGAIMTHGLSESIGCLHYKNDPRLSDKELFDRGYNRVYDTVEMEANLVSANRLVGEALEAHDWSRPACSWEIHRAIGKKLCDTGQMPSILGCAYQRDVPVFVPAFTDSELGLDVAEYFLRENVQQKREQDLERMFSAAPPFNPFLDLREYVKRILRAKRLGIVTIGGGVPRNWAQQAGPFIDTLNFRLGCNFTVPRFRYAVRICPEPVHWGGLSGCTYSEGVSWGKFVSREDGGRYAEVHCDATIAWPLLVKAVLEKREL
ncbi:MAG: deoxyhypusine synthase family protein [Pirellulales bacterium]|nr:deoxyhypusine synthase family protein [Pirellulales bacterium]